MLEAEIQKLTAAVEALTAQLKVFTEDEPERLSRNADLGSKVEPEPEPAPEKPAKKAQARATKVPEPEPEAAPEDPKPSVSKDNLRDLAMEISKADSGKKDEILAVLGKHNSKTITALPEDPDVLFDVFTGLSNILAQIAREAE